MLSLISTDGTIAPITARPEYSRSFLYGPRVGQYTQSELAAILGTSAQDLSVCTTIDGQSRLVFAQSAMQSAPTNQVATNLSPFDRIAGDVIEVSPDMTFDAYDVH